jgi:recombination protein RecT
MTTMQTAIARQSNDIGAVLRANAGELARALPRTAGVDVDRLCRLGLTTIRTNPQLARCSVPSLLAAMHLCVQYGMDPDPRLGLVYLVPYGQEATVVVGYRGLMELARRSGKVRSVEAHVVYSGDEFEVRYGSDAMLRHVPALDERGEPRAVWALARLDSGDVVFDVLTVGDVERARKSSRAKGGPWDSHWDEMARKTAVRRLAKYLPLSAELAGAIALDGQRVQGVSDGDIVTVDVPDDEPPPSDAPAPTPPPERRPIYRGDNGAAAKARREVIARADELGADPDTVSAWWSARTERDCGQVETWAPSTCADVLRILATDAGAAEVRAAVGVEP